MLNSILDSNLLAVSSPLVAGDLVVFPLIKPGTAVPSYLTLTEALQKHLVQITEVSEGGSVPQLLLVNHATQPVLLLDGEELVGAKQNRVLNLTVLVPAMSQTVIPVSCIEQGRWHWRSRQFEAANRTLYASARAEKMSQVSRSMRFEDSYRSDQHAIWESIGRKAANFEMRSPTGAASDIYENRRALLDDMVMQVRPQTDQVGAVFLVRGRLVGAEIFGSAPTFARLLPKLVRSYGLDAIDVRDAALSRHRRIDGDPAMLVRVFLERLMTAPALLKPALGLGTDLRIEDRDLVGAALVHDGAVVHLSAFTREA
jgi:hypothetical protein